MTILSNRALAHVPRVVAYDITSLTVVIVIPSVNHPEFVVKRTDGNSRLSELNRVEGCVAIPVGHPFVGQ